MPRDSVPLLCAALALVACGGAGSSADGERTLENCATSIADDAPAFFQRYFKCVTVTMSGDAVVIESNGLPPHKSAYYEEDHPNWTAFDTSRGEAYQQNPNRLSDVDLSFTIPNAPESRGLTVDASIVDGEPGSSTSEYSMGPAGIALDGTAMFNPLARPGDDIAQERFTFDAYNAHPAPDGAYHYHSVSPGPLEVLQKAGLVTSTKPGEAEIELYGVMCDGTVVLGCTELDGTTPVSDDLDGQGGHVHDLVAKDGTNLWTARYHTHICVGRYPFEYTPEIQFYSTCDR